MNLGVFGLPAGSVKCGFSEQLIITASQDWIVPDGIKVAEVILVGGGGGSDGSDAVVPGAGGTTSFGKSTDSYYFYATGGSGAPNGGGDGVDGGIGVGGDINMRGRPGDLGGKGSFTLFNFRGNISYADGTGFFPGCGGAGNSNGSVASNGAAGGAAIKWVTDLIPGTRVPIVIGAGGTRGTGSYPGNFGGAGVCIIRW